MHRVTRCCAYSVDAILLLSAMLHHAQGQPCGAANSSTANEDHSSGGLSLLLECQEQQDSSSGSIRCIGPLDDDVRSSITSTAATAADGGSVYGDDDDDSNTEVNVTRHYCYCYLLLLACSYCYYHCTHLLLLCCCVQLVLLLPVPVAAVVHTSTSAIKASLLLLQGCYHS
jgi:hypothetical protein